MCDGRKIIIRGGPTKLLLKERSDYRMSSDHDKAVLESIFNPFLPLGEGVNNQSHVIEEEIESEDETEEVVEVKRLELEGVRRAEAGDPRGSVELLTKALEIRPNTASALNNRAQAYRLIGDDVAALADLNGAMELTRGRGQVAAQVLCQRALVHQRSGDPDSALADLRAAAALGSGFAKQQLVQMNPYAAMCNQMLRQLFNKMQQPSESVRTNEQQHSLS